MAKKQTFKPKPDNVRGIIHPAQDRFFDATSAKDSIAALKEILPQYLMAWYFPPNNDLSIRERFYWPIRLRLVDLRKKYGANWPPVPATIPELEDWITDVESALGNAARETVERASHSQDDRPKWIQPLSAPKWADIRARFTFAGPQAFFDGKDLGLPTGAEVNPVEILKKLVESFGKVVPYKDLDENSDDTASDFLRSKKRTIKLALQRLKVPAKIDFKKWAGYVLVTSQAQS